MPMDEQRKDFYKILGIDRHASQEEIKRAYKRLAIIYHPDKNIENQDNSVETFREISEAYETLSDGDKRNSYDVSFIRGANLMESEARFNFQDAETLFKNFFKSSGHRYFGQGEDLLSSYVNGKRVSKKPNNKYSQNQSDPFSPKFEEKSSKQTDTQFDQPFNYLTDIGGDGISKSVSTVTKSVNGKTVTMRRTTVKKRDGTKDVTEETMDDGNVEIKSYSLGVGEGFGRKAVQ